MSSMTDPMTLHSSPIHVWLLDRKALENNSHIGRFGRLKFQVISKPGWLTNWMGVQNVISWFQDQPCQYNCLQYPLMMYYKQLYQLGRSWETPIMRNFLESNYSIRVLRSTYLDGTLVIPIHREENNPIAKTPRHRWIVQWSEKTWKCRLSL